MLKKKIKFSKFGHGGVQMLLCLSSTSRRDDAITSSLTEVYYFTTELFLLVLIRQERLFLIYMQYLVNYCMTSHKLKISLVALPIGDNEQTTELELMWAFRCVNGTELKNKQTIESCLSLKTNWRSMTSYQTQVNYKIVRHAL